MTDHDDARARSVEGWRRHRETWAASDGSEGTEVQGAPVLRLEAMGRRSGEPRWVLLTFQSFSNGWIVAGTNAGADHHPNWWQNIVADGGRARMTVDGTTTAVVARELAGPERERAWTKLVTAIPTYQAYADRTSRSAPVILLTPA